MTHFLLLYAVQMLRRIIVHSDTSFDSLIAP